MFIEETETTISDNFNLFLKQIEGDESEDHRNGDNIINEGTKAIKYLLNIGSRSRRAIHSDIDEEPEKSFFDIPEKNSVDKCEATNHNHKRNSKDRIKRETDLDPVNNAKSFSVAEDEGSKLEYIRLKRKAEKILHYLDREFQRCSRDTKGDENCKDIYDKFVLLTEEIKKRFSDFAHDFKEHNQRIKDSKAKNGDSIINLDNKNETHPELKEEEPITAKPEESKLVPVKQNHHEEDLVSQVHLSDGFYYSYQHPPKIHEELIDDAFNTMLDMIYPEINSVESSPSESERKSETNKEESNKGAAAVPLKTQDITGIKKMFIDQN